MPEENENTGDSEETRARDESADDDVVDEDFDEGLDETEEETTGEDSSPTKSDKSRPASATKARAKKGQPKKKGRGQAKKRPADKTAKGSAGKTGKKGKKGKPRAPQPKSKANLVTFLIVVALVLVGAGAVYALNRGDQTVEALPNGGKTEHCEAAAIYPQYRTSDVDRTHVDGERVQYPEDPPVGGRHWGSPPPVDDGFYETAIPAESLVHNLEHGQIVVYYNQGDTEMASRLRQYFNERKSFLVVVPRERPLPEGARVAWTAWGASQLCSAFDATALSNFQNFYKNKGPERVRMG